MRKGDKFIKIYLVDFENVLTNINKVPLKEGDLLAVFYSELCDRLPIEFIDSLFKKHVKFSSFRIYNGSKNALDFQLSSALGFMLGKLTIECSDAFDATDAPGKPEYIIVSNDKGYDIICSFWRDRGFNIQRLSFNNNKLDVSDMDIEEILFKKDVEPKKVSTIVLDTKTANNKKFTMDDIKNISFGSGVKGKTVLKIINENPTRDSINKKFISVYGSTKAKAINKKLRSFFKNNVIV